ncbi:hypothetical protein BHM03_00055488 [Ensete ventricosum]|nr:hypothetical protein BHM03_00055488 [Ensete ventricosum]
MQGDVSSPRTGRRNRPQATGEEIQVLFFSLFFFLPPSSGLNDAASFVLLMQGDISSRAGRRNRPQATREEIQVLLFFSLFFFHPPTIETAPLLLSPSLS